MSSSVTLSTDTKKCSNLKEICIQDYRLPNGQKKDFYLTYQVFGQPLHEAPIILVNHALTGNSEVAGKNGWWKNLVGENQIVDTKKYTIICFDIPGNGYNKREDHLITDYQSLTTQVVGDLFWKGLEHLDIRNLHAVLGSSLGGGIAWEMAFQNPKAIAHLIPIATNLKASDWLIGNVLVQEQILNNSSQPIQDARIHAMHLYRNPASFQAKFKGEFITEENLYSVENWLNYHGRALEKRFSLSAYKLMNYLLKTIGAWITEEDIINFATTTTSKIHFITVDTDLLFTKDIQFQNFKRIQKYHKNTFYTEINSIHGHDAFLIEYEQLNTLLQPIFANL